MKSALHFYTEQLDAIREAGTFKSERVITTPQKARIDTTKTNGVFAAGDCRTKELRQLVTAASDGALAGSAL